MTLHRCVFVICSLLLIGANWESLIKHGCSEDLAATRHAVQQQMLWSNDVEQWLWQTKHQWSALMRLDSDMTIRRQHLEEVVLLFPFTWSPSQQNVQAKAAARLPALWLRVAKKKTTVSVWRGNARLHICFLQGRHMSTFVCWFVCLQDHSDNYEQTVVKLGQRL